MRRDLPSPSALLAFEASARLLSFKQAAAELNVSPAAISRQNRNLEDFLGRPLFERLHRKVALTEAGERLAGPVGDGIAGIVEAIAAIKAEEGDRQVTIGSTVGFAFYWLMPRLAQFSEVWPEVTLNQFVADDPVDFSQGRVDLAVRYGMGQWPGLDARFLYADRVYPVCSPAFIEKHGAPESVEALDRYPLIEVHGVAGDQWLDWASWFRHAGHRATGMRRRYLNYHIGVHSALSGEGYALGWHSFIGDLVADGRLLRPLDAEIRSPGAFFLTMPSNRVLSEDVRRFADWIVEAARD